MRTCGSADFGMGSGEHYGLRLRLGFVKGLGLGLELGPVLGLQLCLVIFRSKKSTDPHVRILPVAHKYSRTSIASYIFD